VEVASQADTELLDPLQSPTLRTELPGFPVALDEEQMREQLQQALFDESLGRVLERCEVDQATYLGREGCAVRYLLTLANDRAGVTREMLVTGQVFPTAASAGSYLREKMLPLVPRVDGRKDLEPLATPVAAIGALNMVVFAFPVDGELPALIPATDPAHMLGVLRSMLSSGPFAGHSIRECEPELVDYARRFRCVMRYHLRGGTDGGASEPLTVYGKLFANADVDINRQVVEALRPISEGVGRRRFNVPRSLGWEPTLRLSLLEAIPGVPVISDMLKARLKGKPGTPSALSLEEMIEACAQIAATLHGSDIAIGPRRAFADEIAALRRELAEVRRLTPALGDRIGEWIERLERWEAQSTALPLCFNHGDYTYTQLILEGGACGLVDFDSVCQAEPALDLGQFLAYLRIPAYKAQAQAPGATPGPMGGGVPVVDQLTARFMDAYLDASGAGNDYGARLRERAQAYEVVSLLRRALRSWQKFKPGRLQNALALLEEETAWLPT
jgi:thiamine kinase-like enzyme